MSETTQGADPGRDDLTALMYPLWSASCWWDTAISVSPSVLGFSLAGYAIWLALGDERFRSLISETEEGKPSPFMQVNAAFVHFMLLQVLSLIVALLFKAYFDGESLQGIVVILSSAGFLIFVYSLLCVLAATFAILRVSSWYERFVTSSPRNPNP